MKKAYFNCSQYKESVHRKNGLDSISRRSSKFSTKPGTSVWYFFIEFNTCCHRLLRLHKCVLESNHCTSTLLGCMCNRSWPFFCIEIPCNDVVGTSIWPSDSTYPTQNSSQTWDSGWECAFLDWRNELTPPLLPHWSSICCWLVSRPSVCEIGGGLAFHPQPHYARFSNGGTGRDWPQW